MPTFETDEENKRLQHKDRGSKIRDVITKAVSAALSNSNDEDDDDEDVSDESTKGEDVKDEKTSFTKATEKPNEPIELEDSPKNIKGKTQHWGYHLLLDVSECNENINDEEAIKDFLIQLVKEIKMKAIGKPIVVRVDSEKEGRGVSAVQLIESSTITFHGDDDGYNAYIDIFSCAPFNPQIAIKCVKRYFEPKHVGDLWLHRDAGDWPKKPSEV